MSSNILGDLANATKALNAHRFGVTTAGTNIANVNNPDYARQRAVLGDRGTISTIVGPRGMGVEVVGFQHMRDRVLDRELLREQSINSSLEAQSAALSKAESSVGQEIDRSGDSPFVDGVSSDASGAGGLASSLNQFFNAFHSLSANPASDAEKESLLQKSGILVEKLNVTSQRFEDLKSDLTLQVTTDLGEANALIEEVARLNSEIARAEASHSGQALDLRDLRQARLQDLSKLIQITVSEIPNSSGQIKVSIPTTGGGAPTFDLVNKGAAKEIEFDDSVPGLPTFRIKGTSTNVDVRGGGIHGALTARDGSIQRFLGGLDALASALVVEVNNLYNTGVAPGTTNFFTDAAAADRTALGISLDATLSTGTLRTTNDPAQEQGDNTLALAIAELDEADIAALGNRTISSYYRGEVSDLGAEIATIDSRLEDEGIVFALLTAQQDSVSGVSIDEEMTDMMKFQRAFEATGRVVRSIDEMLDVIINRLF